MNLDNDKKSLHLAWTIGGAFSVSAFAFLLTSFFIPTVTSDGKVIMPAITVLLSEIQISMMILGCVAMGIKLSEEKKTIPSIGFTMLSIAEGVIFITYTISVNSNENMEELYRVFMSSMFLLIPSLILIAFYSEFPRWLNILGLVAGIPMLIENILFAINKEVTQILIMLDGTGLFFMSVTAFFWGLITIRNAKREYKLKHQNSE